MAQPRNNDLELLIKMLGQTSNENDNVVLMAIKKANEQVKKLAGSWEQLLKGHFTIAADPFQGLDMPTTTFKQAPAYNRPANPPPTPQYYHQPRPPKAAKPRRADVSGKSTVDILNSIGL